MAHFSLLDASKLIAFMSTVTVLWGRSLLLKFHRFLFVVRVRLVVQQIESTQQICKQIEQWSLSMWGTS